MTEEQQQRIHTAAQDVSEAATQLIDTIYNLFKEAAKAVTEVIESICEWCLKVYKQVKKFNCNNWRRMNGLPLIHRNKKYRQGQMLRQLL